MATPADVVLTTTILALFGIATLIGLCLPANRKDKDLER